MTYKQLEKIRKEFESLDLSRYRVLTLDEMLKVNGGGSSETDESEEESSSSLDSESSLAESGSTEAASETEDFYVSSHADVANASAGDTITRSDGSTYTVNDKDIEYEQNYCNEHGIDWRGEDEEEAEKGAEELQNESSESQTSSSHSIFDSIFDFFSGVKDWVGEFFGNSKSVVIDNLSNEQTANNRNELSVSNQQHTNTRIIEEHHINRHEYIPMENIGVNGGTNYQVTSVRTDTNLSLFATGQFIGEGLVNNYIPFGNVELIVNGSKVETQSFLYPDSSFIWDGEGKVLGEAKFDYDFLNNDNIDLNFNFGVILKQDAQTCYTTYDSKLVNIK